VTELINNITCDEDINVQNYIDQYTNHLMKIARVFTDHARDLGLGVKLDASNAIQAVNNGTGFMRVTRFCERRDDSGVLHDAQLMTALDCVGELMTAPENNGLVLGAMQSGKTTTSLALQFAGPIVYLLTGRRLYPIYLITSHTSQEDQTKIEITRFLDFYGELSIEIDEKHKCTLREYVKILVNPVFSHSPTVNTYREHILKESFSDTLMGPRLEDFIQRRVSGESIRRIQNICRRANSKGYSPLLIIDEPQFGASDRLVKVEDGFERRPCVLLQIFERIDEALGEDAKDRAFIGLSATPYELHDIEAVWTVKQYLSSTYTGFNYFGGKVIDQNADVEPPRTVSFSNFGHEIGVPFFEHVSLTMYDAQPNTFERFARRIGYSGTQIQYRREVEDTLRAAILHMAFKNTGEQPNGICIRLFNNNGRSHRLLDNLRLPEDKIEIIEYFGPTHKGQSVKRAIRQRSCPALPFLVAVTNRARMGDAFPGEVKWFMEFSRQAANLNALLQGLLGRACGYGKNSTVIMSNENIQLIEDYKREHGGYIYQTSPHSLVTGRYRRGAPTNLIRVRRDMDDPLVTKFFERIDSEVVKPHIIQGSKILSAKRSNSSKGFRFRTGPLLRIAEEVGLFDHLERREIRKKLFPTYPAFKIARIDDEVIHSKYPDQKLSYFLDEHGNCRFTFREWAEGSSNHGGVRSRGYGGRDARDRRRAGDTLEPQVNMRKYDLNTNEVIDDKRDSDGNSIHRGDRKEGNWRADMVTLPLVDSVRELQSGDATYPIERSPYSRLLNTGEQHAAGYIESCSTTDS